MSMKELRQLIHWHEERHALARSKYLEEAGLNGSFTPEAKRQRERELFHGGAAAGLKQLADAFETLRAMTL